VRSKSPAPRRRASPGGSLPSPSEDRLARLEDSIVLIQHALDVQLHRIAAIQVEIDQLKRKS
jgi:hypothetical protein